MSAAALKKIISAENKFEELKRHERLQLICRKFLNPEDQRAKTKSSIKVALKDPDSASLRTPARKTKKGKKAAKKASPEKDSITETPR